MRVTTVFKRLLRLDGVNVTSVVFGINVITVTVVLRRQRLVCSHCSFSTAPSRIPGALRSAVAMKGRAGPRGRQFLDDSWMAPPVEEAFDLKVLVREAPPAGFEPAANGLEVRRSVHLSYEGSMFAGRRRSVSATSRLCGGGRRAVPPSRAGPGRRRRAGRARGPRIRSGAESRCCWQRERRSSPRWGPLGCGWRP